MFDALKVSERTGRASVSVALLELLLSMPRVQIGALIGLSERSISSGVTSALQRIRAGEDASTFGELLHDAAEALSGNENRVDYRERGARLAGLVDIPEIEWREMCKGAKVRVGHHDVRSRHAAAWIWAQLMQQDVRDSPAYKTLGYKLGETHRSYQTFVREQVPLMNRVLLEYGESLV